MWMRVAASHHQSAILKNLHIIDPGLPSQTLRFLYPNIDQAADFGHGHLRKCQIMPRRKTNNPANAALTLGYNNAFLVDIYLRLWRFGLESGEIIVENECVAIQRIALSAGANVSGTQITIRIIGLAWLGLRLLGLALPG